MMLRALGIVVLLVLLGVVVLLALPGWDRTAGEIEGGRRPREAVAQQEDLRRRAAERVGAQTAKQVLFGDLHVHTTFSIDGLIFQTALFGGEGVHPPADACDFARYCSAVDFFSINDHAEGLTPARWNETIESIRQCNARAGDPATPDLVAFVGYEWTQVGETPETHYGHRNVIFPGLAEGELPDRPISALAPGTMDPARGPAMLAARAAGALIDGVLGGVGQFLWLAAEMGEVPECKAGVPSPELPPGCHESAQTPGELQEKLAQWDLETLVIPHGLAWGVHAPPGARLDESLAPDQHEPGTERLLEVFSGHGNSEEFRDLPTHVTDAAGEPICPAPTEDFLPCCWRAGEIMRERCGDLPEAECEARVREARRLALEAGTSPHLVFPDTRAEDWLDCDQCRDCFKPAMTLRPRQSAQYSLAAGARWGFIASSDVHKARPASGYKQFERLKMTDARGYASPRLDSLVRPRVMGDPEDPQQPQKAVGGARLRTLLDVEREASFMYPGGAVAVHAAGRDRRAIWDALARKEAYGTSGPRILLWFDLRNGPEGSVPMGGEAVLDEPPAFEVRAVGDFVQRPGCPVESVRGLSAERLESLCAGECYHPGTTRHPIVAVEVIRILERRSADEDPASLIEDPWLRFDCAPDPTGCTVRFRDPEYPELAAQGRSAAYYVRALQEATPAINGDTLRTRFDAEGRAVAVEPCHGSWRTPFDEDCLAPVHERAWSSPIFIDPR